MTAAGGGLAFPSVHGIIDISEFVRSAERCVLFILQSFDIFVKWKGAAMELGKIIAQNLRSLREERGLTLGQLSKLSGISKAMLSDMEKGGSNPTINTIWKLANGLNVPYTKLMDQVERETAVIRRGEPVPQSGETDHYRVYCYFPSTPTRNFELFYVELDPRSSNVSIGHSKRAQEYLYIIRGRLVLRTEADTYELGEGDSMMFDSSLDHTYVNDRDMPLSFLVINFYPG